MLKLAWIISKVEEEGRFPTDRELRDVGHDIKDLLGVARTINGAKKLSADPSKVDDDLCTEIVDLLTAFAMRARCYNLDVLTGSKKPKGEEPLAAWDRIVGAEVVSRHHRNTRRMKESLAFSESGTDVPGIVVSHVLETLDRRQSPVIYLFEHFGRFNTLDRKAVLRRKKWNEDWGGELRNDCARQCSRARMQSLHSP